MTVDISRERVDAIAADVLHSQAYSNNNYAAAEMLLALREALDRAEGRWQPIATAPKDGREFLGFWPDEYGNGSWNIERTYAACESWHTPNNEAAYGDDYAPRWWMPMPPAPEGEPT